MYINRETYVMNGITYTLITDDLNVVHTFIETRVQSFKLVITNSRGGPVYNRIVRMIRLKRIRNFNQLIGLCKKSVQLEMSVESVNRRLNRMGVDI